jgi:hypothetical protein
VRRTGALGAVLVATVASGALGTGGASSVAATAAPHPFVTAAARPVALPAPAGSDAANLRTHSSSSGSVPAYWLVASDGGIFSFGGTGFYGSMGGQHLNKPIVGMAGTHDSLGYWLVASDGGIFSFGDARFYGSTGSLALVKPVVGMAVTPDGNGYWLVAADGGIFTFGDAGFYGSMGGKTLNQPIVGMTPTGDGKGYWLVASDGGIFAFGDAKFYGSTGAMTLNAPVVGMVSSSDGAGYMMVAADGGIFAFGDAEFHGSLGGEPLTNPIVAMAPTPTGDGYWFTDTNGAVTAFGNAGYFGSTTSPLNAPIVAMAEGTGSGAYSSDPYPSGSYGYDISNYQCGDYPPTRAIGIVEVVGGSFDPTNSCLSGEAQWAGPGLNLYMFLTYATQVSGPSICDNDPACNAGFAAAEDAVQQARAAGVNTAVPWWLDVEPANWSSSTTENANLVGGAISGLRAEGINNVGIYASPGQWNNIVGDYQPPLPYWMAWYSGQGGPYNCANASTWEDTEQLPTGPVVLTQYTDDAGGFDGDYAC